MGKNVLEVIIMILKSILIRFIVRTGLAAALVLAIFAFSLPVEAQARSAARNVERQSRTQLDRVLEELGNRSLYVVPGDVLGKRSGITPEGVREFYDPPSKAITNMNQFNNSLNSTVSGIMGSAMNSIRSTP